MDNITENDNTNDPNTLTSKTVETVEKPKKQKRKFEWTPKRKEAFEKCVAARNKTSSSTSSTKTKTKTSKNVFFVFF